MVTTRATKASAKKAAATPPAKKTAAKPPAKPATRRKALAAPARDRSVQVDLPTRTESMTGQWMTDTQGYATLAALLADITTPRIADWNDHADGTASRPHDHGLLHYRHEPRQLTWIALCPQGAHHAYPLAGPGDLPAARRHLDGCTENHSPDKPVRNLADAFSHDTERTQPLAAADIAAGLNARATAADEELPKEHPSE